MIRRSATALVPLLVALTAVVVALHRSEVGYRSIALFGALQLVAYVIPGTLLLRGLRGRAGSWFHDATLGTILAHAVTVLVYLAGRAAGFPLLVWAVPVVTVTVFAAVPGLRRYWRAAPGAREPAWFTWGMALGVVLLCAWYAGLSVMNPVSGPSVLWQSTDHTYLLALAGEVRNHVPPTTPFVVDEGLNYHWFTFADLAAFSWQGGQELSLLLFRLGPLWCLVNAFLAFGLLAERLAGRKSAGLVAVALAVLVGSVTLTQGADTYVVDSTMLLVNWVGSPTQGFGQLIAVAVLYVSVGLLRGDERGRGPWILYLVLTLVLMGAKATFIPVVGAGVALVVGVELVRHRRLPRAAFAMGVVLAAELVFAQLVLFGGTSQGITVGPGDDLRRLGEWIQVPAASGALPLAAVAALLVFGWLAPLAGAGLLLLKPRPAPDRAGPGDPATQLVAGMVVAAVVVVLVLAHPGFSEYFFLRSGLPFGYLLVACGLARLADYRLPRRAWTWLALSAAGGLAYVGLARLVTRPEAGVHETALRALLLVIGAALVAVLAGGLGALAGRGLEPGARRALALACLAATTLGMGAARTADLVQAFPLPPFDPNASPAVYRPLPEGAFAAARYVRARSGPEDMLATNVHCRTPVTDPCDIRSFWISAYAERRVVIQGWGYTATANDLSSTPAESLTLPYWNPELLELNDAVFTDPSPRTLAALTDRYPVRWLVVDRRFDADLPGLRALLPDHRRFGQVVVFRVPERS